MATPAELRVAIEDLAVLADRDTGKLWRQVRSAEQARDGLRDILPDLVRAYVLASATITADWYDEQREASEVPGSFRAIPAEPADLGADTLALWAVGPLFAAEPDWTRSRVLLRGGLQLRIANASRSTVALSAEEDPSAQGWMRAGSGGCAFCAMLIGRGAVYTVASVDFGAHDNCRCSAVPAFSGRPRPVRPYEPSERTASDADRARVRDWIAKHQTT